jgi:hypothetical protein
MPANRQSHASRRSVYFQLLPVTRRPNPSFAGWICVPVSRHPHRVGSWAFFPMAGSPDPMAVHIGPIAWHPHMGCVRRRAFHFCLRWRGCLAHNHRSRRGSRHRLHRTARVAMMGNAATQKQTCGYSRRQHTEYDLFHNFLALKIPAMAQADRWGFCYFAL